MMFLIPPKRDFEFLKATPLFYCIKNREAALGICLRSEILLEKDLLIGSTLIFQIAETTLSYSLSKFDIPSLIFSPKSSL